MEMARICRERFENVKNAYAYDIGYELVILNILSYQNIKFLRRFVAKKIKLENIKNINVLYLQSRFIIVGTNVMMISRFLPYKL